MKLTKKTRLPVSFAVVGIVALGTLVLAANGQGKSTVSVDVAEARAQNASNQDAPTSRQIYMEKFAKCMQRSGMNYRAWNPDKTTVDPNQAAAQALGDQWLKADMACRTATNQAVSAEAEELGKLYERAVAVAYRRAVETRRIPEPEARLQSAESMSVDDYLEAFPEYQQALRDEISCMNAAGFPVEREADGTTDFVLRYMDQEAPKADKFLSPEAYREQQSAALAAEEECAKPVDDLESQLEKDINY